MPTSLTPDEARRITLRAQGFLGADSRRGGVPAMLRRLGAVQLDTISVLARSHELIAYARLGAVPREKVERAYWGGGAFEYWCHAACVLPIDQWPLYSFRRRAFRERKYRWHEVPPTVDKVLDQVRDGGPLTTTDLGGAKNGGPWWDWSDVKIAVEWLLDIGEVVCTRRVGWRRVYDLAERAVPAHLLEPGLTDRECVIELARTAVAAMGVANRADLVEFLRLSKEHAAILDDALREGATGLAPVHVAGWPAARAPRAAALPSDAPNAWADPAALESEPRGRHRVTLLSPFDSLVWNRERTERIFGFSHRLEAYVPKPKRVYGYFTMPVLAGGRLVARVDPAREGTTLVARHVAFEPGAATRHADAVREALHSAAEWVGCETVRVDRVTGGDVRL
ncbi:crosslink repair DNA glycosylase YcaQ family protein [Spongiactinospora sp. TRM90649]|uniref:winged helix-turn-helix domain-containing protein n=1 Tax=Spongiactinospora sp. TRM90649 TaxID=3031114 RepID=UPI0023F7CD24|nr:crosslink repair DNA glycosylase YcaQ family protein [Spongiactinospora sp. TRM90649]MDF5751369.1 crosslink repair DNA glycosylase YcaQ family protein [Spongiactinospora sp. TRM90649]